MNTANVKFIYFPIIWFLDNPKRTKVREFGWLKAEGWMKKLPKTKIHLFAHNLVFRQPEAYKGT